MIRYFFDIFLDFSSELGGVMFVGLFFVDVGDERVIYEEVLDWSVELDKGIALVAVSKRVQEESVYYLDLGEDGFIFNLGKDV